MKCVVCLLLLQSLRAEDIVSYYENLIETDQAIARNSAPVQNASQYEAPPMKPTVYGTYDYIIVGAGAAGAVVAARLTENRQVTVLLLEAGGPESNFTDIPTMMLYLQGLEYNWMYNSTSQKGLCKGNVNSVCPYPRGKSLGGTTTINAIKYVRGNRLDYDSWAVENPGWSYEEVLPYFIKSENSSIDGDSGYHGTKGELHVQYHRPNNVQYQAFIDANLERGRKVVDYNGKTQLGVAQTQFNMNHGRRDSTGRAFIQRIYKRKNLKILTHSFALKVLIDARKSAYGVKFTYEGKLYKAKANREVILSAGAIASPQLLMLSGIGPKEHLQELGIPLVQDLAVGDNLQDHPAFYGLRIKTNFGEPARSLRQNVEEYLEGYGALTCADNTEALGFYRSKSSTSTRPDIELLMNPSNSSTDPMVQKAYHFTDETFEALIYDAEPSHTFTINVMLLSPKSRGTVRLQSRNPYKYPLIDPQGLTNPTDVEILYEGVQIALDLLDTAPFKELNATLTSRPHPFCRELEYLSKEFWVCQIRMLTSTIYHPVGTCRMGPDPGKGAVVNHELKVHGVKRLRVADASIMPTIVAGHTSAPTTMIGEMVSDMIKGRRITVIK